MTTKKVKMQAPKKTKKEDDNLFIILPMSAWQDTALRWFAHLIGFRSDEKIYVITVNRDYLK